MVCVYLKLKYPLAIERDTTRYISKDEKDKNYFIFKLQHGLRRGACDEEYRTVLYFLNKIVLHPNAKGCLKLLYILKLK